MQNHGAEVLEIVFYIKGRIPTARDIPQPIGFTGTIHDVRYCLSKDIAGQVPRCRCLNCSSQENSPLANPLTIS